MGKGVAIYQFIDCDIGKDWCQNVEFGDRQLTAGSN